MQHELKASGLDDASCQHILTAQCALLDEAVKGRGVEDEPACSGMTFRCRHFLGTMDAGDTLCERCVMCCVNGAQPGRGHLFQRLMLLGFIGSFRSLHDPRAPEAGQRAR
ncbi:DotU family type IV/VI secretion system protein [Klebsiella pneumoniae]|nr:DotU family type IV/VI secretion system protein [Klebsiella pneumoniae]